MNSSTPRLGANSQVPPLTGAAGTIDSLWRFAREFQGAPKDAGFTTLRDFRSALGLNHFKSHSGLWPLPLL